VTSDEPAGHEQAEEYIAHCLQAHVSQAFSKLKRDQEEISLGNQLDNNVVTHRQEYIARIHQNEDYVASRCKVERVRADEEQDGDDVVGEHLPVVLSPFLDIDDENLLA
jgi:hypothetical protein